MDAKLKVFDIPVAALKKTRPENGISLAHFWIAMLLHAEKKGCRLWVRRRKTDVHWTARKRKLNSQVWLVTKTVPWPYWYRSDDKREKLLHWRKLVDREREELRSLNVFLQKNIHHSLRFSMKLGLCAAWALGMRFLQGLALLGRISFRSECERDNIESPMGYA